MGNEFEDIEVLYATSNHLSENIGTVCNKVNSTIASIINGASQKKDNQTYAQCHTNYTLILNTGYTDSRFDLQLYFATDVESKISHRLVGFLGLNMYKEGSYNSALAGIDAEFVTSLAEHCDLCVDSDILTVEKVREISQQLIESLQEINIDFIQSIKNKLEYGNQQSESEDDISESPIVTISDEEVMSSFLFYYAMLSDQFRSDMDEFSKLLLAERVHEILNTDSLETPAKFNLIGANAEIAWEALHHVFRRGGILGANITQVNLTCSPKQD